MTVKLRSLGAAGEVTGSLHILDLGDELKILLDAGSFQGLNAGEKNMNLPSSIDPMSIKYIFISHGHVDHIGRLPLLVKRGFHGQIISTSATKDISFIVLDNMVKVQNSNIDFEKDKDIGSITEKDIEITKRLFEPIEKDYGKWTSEDGKLVVNFLNAEHIVGSSSIYIEKPIRLLYTGDLGGTRSSLHGVAKPPESDVDYLIMESTYGNREIGKSDTMVLVNAINDIREYGGRLLIPILAIDKAEEILALLKSLSVEENVYLDTPMGLDVLSVYTGNSFKKVSEKFNRVKIKGRNLNVDQLHYFFTPKNFIEVTQKNPDIVMNSRGNCIILSSSGMLEGGRIMKYLPGILEGSRNTVLFCSFLGEGTLGKRILDGKKEVYIKNTDNKMIKVNVEASIRKMDGISGHADKNDLLAYLGKLRILPKKIFLIHGEPNASKYLKNEIEYMFKIPTIVSKYDVEYELNNDVGNETERRQVVTKEMTKDKGEIDGGDFDDFCTVVVHEDFSPRRR
jgi:metallo-beta-lactamase family protein